MGVSIYCSMVMHISHALFEYMQMRTRPHFPTHPGSLSWWKAALVYSWDLKMMRFVVAQSGNCRLVNNVEKMNKLCAREVFSCQLFAECRNI